jgi:hypothetical protein
MRDNTDKENLLMEGKMKTMTLVFLVLMALSNVALAVESIDHLERMVATINGGHNADGKQAEYLCKYYKVDTKDSEGKPIWTCVSRAKLLGRYLKENGYEFEYKTHPMYRNTGDKGIGDKHMYIEVKSPEGWTVPLLDVWSI